MYQRWNEEYYQHCLAKWEWLQCQVERAREREEKEAYGDKSEN